MYWFTFRGESPMGQANISHTPQSQQLAASPKQRSYSALSSIPGSRQKFRITRLGRIWWPMRLRGQRSVHIRHWMQALRVWCRMDPRGRVARRNR